MKSFKFFCLILFFFSTSVYSSDEGAPKLLGHNLSNTSNVLDPGECTIGFLHAGCGVSEKLTVGSSPWMALSYKMAALALRYQLSHSANQQESFQLSYLKTFEKRYNYFEVEKDEFGFKNSVEKFRGYEMESLWMMYVRSKKLAPHFTLHYNFHINYYFNETAPFSLRRPYEDPSPWQLNATTLFEVDLYKGWFIQGELGLLDIINSPVHTHAGVSLGWKWSKGYISLGFSQTSTFKALFSPDDREDYGYYLISREEEGYESELDLDKIDNDYSIHAEITAQFFF